MTVDTPKAARDVNRRAVTGGLWLLGQKLGLRLASLLTFTALARLLAPSDFGLIAMASVVLGLIALLVEFGLGTYIIRSAEQPRLLSTCFWTSLALGTCMSGLLLLAAPGVLACSTPRN